MFFRKFLGIYSSSFMESTFHGIFEQGLIMNLIYSSIRVCWSFVKLPQNGNRNSADCDRGAILRKKYSVF